MALKFFKYALPVGIGLLLCSCSTFHDEEYENFIKSEEEKIRNEFVLLEKQKQANKLEQMALTKQKEQLKREYQLLSQDREKMKQEKIALSKLKKQLDSEKKQKKVDYQDNGVYCEKDDEKCKCEAKGEEWKWILPIFYLGNENVGDGGKCCREDDEECKCTTMRNSWITGKKRSLCCYVLSMERYWNDWDVERNRTELAKCQCEANGGRWMYNSCG